MLPLPEDRLTTALALGTILHNNTRPSSNGYIFIFGLQHFAFFFLQQALLWFFPQHDFAFPAGAGVLARAAEEAAISTAAQTRLIATALTFLISRIS